MGTRELQEILEREGIEISLRTIQRDLNQISQRFPIESNGTVPQGWRWRSDAPIQSLPHMTSSQAVTFMMVEEHLRHLCFPPSLLEEMMPWFDLVKRSLSTKQCQTMDQPCAHCSSDTSRSFRQLWINMHSRQFMRDCYKTSKLNVSIVPEPIREKIKPISSILLALVQKGAVIYLICTRNDKTEVQTFALHRFKAATVLDSRALHPINFDIDHYIDSGALGFRVDYSKPTEQIQLKLTMTENTAKSFYESQLSKDQTALRH